MCGHMGMSLAWLTWKRATSGLRHNPCTMGLTNYWHSLHRLSSIRQEIEAMQCLKCNGLMVTEWISSFFSEEFVWRCVNCGLMMDPTTIQNLRTAVSVHKLPNPVST